MSRTFRRVGVVGLGTMGAGIVEVMARAGLGVVAAEADAAAVARGRLHVESSTARAVRRGKLSPESERDLLDRITYTADLGNLGDVDLVVEAVPEHIDLKRRVFARLDEVCAPGAVLATNTSSLSVTEIAASTTRPGNVIGMHFFNPAPVMALVEVVRTVVTAPDVVDDVSALAQRLGKVAVVVGDRAGFVANALLFGYLNAAARTYERGDADREDLDAAMTLGCGLPLGPLALLDLIGLDTACQILETMYEQGRDRLHAPAPILKQLVSAGFLGRKSGRGFYTYKAPGVPEVVPEAPASPPRLPGEPARPVSTVGVVGSGRRAADLADVFSSAGYEVVVVRERGSGGGDGDALGNSAGDGLERLSQAQFVVEAVVDELAAKRAIFSELDAVCAPGTVLATTTSTLPVVECAAATMRPADVIGMHLLQPVASAQLVEVVSTVCTAADAAATGVQVAQQLGKRAVRCRDRAGFLVNALLYPYLNDAVKMVEAGYATADDIDSAMTAGCGYSTGPFEVLERVGPDVALTVQRAIWEQSGEPGHVPAPLLRQLVAARRQGRAAGIGLRDYR